MADLSINMLPVSDGLTDDGLLVVYQNNEAQSIRGELIKRYARESTQAYVEAAQNAAAQAEQAAKDAQAAADSVAYVTEKAEEAAQAALAAQQAKEAAETARQVAEQAAALAAQQAAQDVESALLEYLTKAEQARDDAQSAAQAAAGEATSLVDTQLAQYVADAQAAKIAAEAARDEAQAFAGGDFLDRPTYDPQGRKQDIFAYVDDIAQGKAASAHNQAASTITAGTFAGQVVASGSGQTPGTSLLRNSRLVSADTNPTVNGEINWTYK